MLSRHGLMLTTALMSLLGGCFVGNVQAGTAPDIVVTSVYWGMNPLGSVSVHPGDTNVLLSIVLSNVGDTAARQVKTKLVLRPPFSYVYYVGGRPATAETVEQNPGDIQPDFSFTARHVLTVASDAVAGVHILDLIVNYKSASGLAQIEKTLTVDVPVFTGDVTVQRVITVPAKVYPGDNQIALKVWLVNGGTGTTTDLLTRLIVREPFKPCSGGSDRFFLGTMRSGQVSKADFYVDVNDGAEFGSYNLKLVTDSSGPSGPIEIGAVPLYVSEKVVFQVLQV